jgi:hypothetical protein
MTVPRRYRLALRLYPAAYRARRGAELVATLADGDDDRGGPSTREAAALAYRGLIERARLAASPDGLLVAAAALVVLALAGGFTWSERVFLFRGAVGAIASDPPGFWWAHALSTGAFVVLAVSLGPAWDSRRRRTATALLALPFTVVMFTSPGRLFHAGLPDAETLVEFVKWAPAAVFDNWPLTLPASASSMLVTWIALWVCGRVGPVARRRALGGAMVLLCASVVGQAWHRPNLPAEYGRSALADLGPATYIAALGLLTALAALWRLRPGPGAPPLRRR